MQRNDDDEIFCGENSKTIQDAMNKFSVLDRKLKKDFEENMRKIFDKNWYMR